MNGWILEVSLGINNDLCNDKRYIKGLGFPFSCSKLLAIFLPTPTFHNTTLLLVQNPTIVCTLSELPLLALSVSCTPDALSVSCNVRPRCSPELRSSSLRGPLNQAPLGRSPLGTPHLHEELPRRDPHQIRCQQHVSPPDRQGTQPGHLHGRGPHPSPPLFLHQRFGLLAR